MRQLRCCVYMLSLLIVFVSLSCDKDGNNPVDPGGSDNPYGTIIITVSDEYGVPREGAIVLVQSGGDRLFSLSDENGISRFDNLQPGQYQFATRKRLEQGSENPVDLMNQIRSSYYDIDEYLNADQTIHLTVYYPVDPIDIHFAATECSENEWLPLADVELTFDDPAVTVITDENGYAFAEKVLFNKDSYFHCRSSKNGISGSGKGFAYVRDSKQYLHVKFDNSPEIEILMPETGKSLVGPLVPLSGIAYDFEDGEVSYETYTWHSDLDGEIGGGSEITADLSAGHHRITLMATDSCGNANEVQIDIHVSYYNGDSYFPLPLGGVWKYGHDIIEITTVNERGEVELWTLDDLIVSLGDSISRSSVMTWTVKNDKGRSACRYVLIDYLDNDGNTYYVTDSEEQLTIYEDNGLFNTPLEEIHIETAYTPQYTLWINQCDPQENDDMENMISTESSITYTMFGIGSYTVTENDNITVLCSSGSPEEVTTGLGTFTAIPVKSTYNGVERTWWLTRGIGIVQMKYDLFGETVTSSLYETNMDDFMGGAASKYSVGSFSSLPLQVTFDAEDAAGQLRELCGLMRSMCPR